MKDTWTNTTFCHSKRIHKYMLPYFESEETGSVAWAWRLPTTEHRGDWAACSFDWSTFKLRFDNINLEWHLGSEARWLRAAVVPQCLHDSWRTETHRHGLSVDSSLHIWQTPRFGRCHPPGSVGGARCAVLPRRQGAGLPRLREAMRPDQLHRRPTAGLWGQTAALHGAHRWVETGRWNKLT